MKFLENKRNVIILVASLAILVIAFLYRKELKNLFKPGGIDENTDTCGTKSNPSNEGKVQSKGFPLKLGSKGENVKRIQRIINDKISANIVFPYKPDYLPEDGNWGAKTDKAALKWLKTNSITEEEFKWKMF